MKNIEIARSLDLNKYHGNYKERGVGHRKAIQMGVDWVAAGKINLKTLITHEVALSEVEKGLHLCHDHPDETIKVIVRIDD